MSASVIQQQQRQAARAAQKTAKQPSVLSWRTGYLLSFATLWCIGTACAYQAAQAIEYMQFEYEYMFKSENAHDVGLSWSLSNT